MNERNLQPLLREYLNGTATDEQLQVLSQVFSNGGQDDEIQEIIREQLRDLKETAPVSEAELERRLQSIFAQSNSAKVVPVFRRRAIRWLSAACIIGLLVAGYWLFTQQSKQGDDQDGIAVEKDVPAPASTKATITFADGRTISLDSLTTGTLAQEGGVKVTRTATGELVYDVSGLGQAPGSTILYNTLVNPRGSQVVSLVLSDGSKVWLNAGSSVRYPVAFISNERRVEITGEAYFEVAHNAAKQFKVVKDAVEVTVLGTHFNVNAYDDESALRVTLLEGKVSVSTTVPANELNDKPNNELTLAPGQQAIIHQSTITLQKNIDIDQVMAWKNGIFNFEGLDIQQVMRQLSRWYDVEVQYQGKVPTGKFFGGMERNLSLAQVLKILRQSGVEYELKGRKLVITQQ